MQEQFLSFILKEKLFVSTEKILLTVSGGIDSIAMCELFHQAGFNFAIAHCNFQLRGKESNGDEKFVEQLAKKYKVPYYVKHFNTAEYREDKNISIQMAARELRYQWFEEVRKHGDFNYIATAHHNDDSIETFFINLIRGTGIAGLHGILPKQGNIIRPLLFTSKEDIISFASKENLKYREDSSNASDKYMRNKIRHHIIPVLKELNPNIETTITKDIEKLRGVETIFKIEIETKRRKLVKQELDTITIPIKELKKLNPIALYLYEFLSPYNFNYSNTEEVIKAFDEESGKKFFSETHRLIKDREFLYIEEIAHINNKEPAKKILIRETKMKLNLNTIRLRFRRRYPAYPIKGSELSARLDYDKLVFPLELRKWKEGDYFYPLGMKGKKKLSDFFIDNKLSLNRKENIWLLTSEGKIVWVIGMRIDERFKITEQTKIVYWAYIDEG